MSSEVYESLFRVSQLFNSILDPDHLSAVGHRIPAAEPVPREDRVARQRV